MSGAIDTRLIRTTSDWLPEIRLTHRSRLLLVAAVALVVLVPVLFYSLFYDKLEEITVQVPEYQRPPTS